MDIKLCRLKLAHFKGVREFVLDADCQDVEVHGDNGTGKTTLFDALTWVLFGKDSRDRADFELKTLRPDGTPEPRLDHTVEAEFDVDGQPLVLRRTYREKWTKRRGSVDKELTGHVTKCWIDGVPVKMAEYEARVTQLVPENLFRLLTNPRHFCEALHWKERREILLEMCGDVDDADVIGANPALADLPGYLKGRTLDEHRKVLVGRRREINAELEQIPARIDEVTRGLPEETADETKAQAALDAARRDREEAEAARRALVEGGAVGERKAALQEARAKLAEAKEAASTRRQEAVDAASTALRQAKADIDEVRASVARLRRRKDDNDQTAKRLRADMDRLRAEYYEVAATQFKPVEGEEASTCPACGQPLPQSMVAAARRKAREAFNAAKAKRLEEIDGRGRSLKEEVAELSRESDELVGEVAALEAQLKHLQLVSAKRQEAYEEVCEARPASDEIVQLEVEVARLEAEVERLKADNEGAIASLDRRVADASRAVEDIEAELARIGAAKRGRKRIEELKATERALAKEYEDIERQLFLADEFVKTKVALLDRINARFELARFKLFNVLIHGGVEECCEVTVGGVPYGGGLNNGAQLNAGLDIINALSRHYGITAPIFCENAEGVTSLLQTDAQQIRLYVNGDDPQMRVVVSQRQMEPAQG